MAKADGIRAVLEGSEFFNGITPEQQRWLIAYIETASMRKASDVAEVPFLEAMAWIREDDNFLAEVEKARYVIGLDVEAIVMQRIKFDPEVSDRLTIKVLEALMPDRYSASKSDSQEEEHGQKFGYVSQVITDGEAG